MSILAPCAFQFNISNVIERNQFVIFLYYNIFDFRDLKKSYVLHLLAQRSFIILVDTNSGLLQNLRFIGTWSPVNI